MKHAKLSASGAKKWLNCPLSVTLESLIEEPESPYAIEGTKAHNVSELKLKRKLNRISKEIYDKEILNLDVDEEMHHYTDDYCDNVLEIVYKYDLNYSLIKLEGRVDFSPWVPEGFGTSDVIIISGSTMNIIDLKYGKGVQVNAENNPQLMLYALGALNDYGFLCSIDNVIITIIQPRLDHISSFEMSAKELLSWGDSIKPKAFNAFNGVGECVVGSHCTEGFCKARPICRAYAKQKLNLKNYGNKEPEQLTNQETVEILNLSKGLVEWCNSVREYAIKQALKGEEYEGYKLVEGRSTRAFNIDEDKVIDVLKTAGFTQEELCKTTLKSLTTLEKQLGKKEFEKHLGEFISKKQGAPTLSPVTDQRPIYNSAEEDFKDV